MKPFSFSLMTFSPSPTGISVAVKLDFKEKTVWLNLNQIAQLFERDKSVISKHLKNIFKEEELKRDSVVAFFATTARDGKTYNVEYFNLEAILSVGYRINSKKGIEFRQWANQVLQDHLLKGFSFHEEKLKQEGLQELEKSLELLKQTLLTKGCMIDNGAACINIIREYTRAWVLLNAFDEDRLSYLQHHQNEEITLTYEQMSQGILKLKENLYQQKEASSLFGQERDKAFHQIWGSIHQSFAGALLYPSVYERAAHLFYFVIKDHPFVDGNKRIASFLLLFYLSSYHLSFSLKNEGLVALTLLIAQSNPQDKESMIKLILNLLEKDFTCS